MIDEVCFKPAFSNLYFVKANVTRDQYVWLRDTNTEIKVISGKGIIARDCKISSDIIIAENAYLDNVQIDCKVFITTGTVVMDKASRIGMKFGLMNNKTMIDDDIKYVVPEVLDSVLNRYSDKCKEYIGEYVDVKNYNSVVNVIRQHVTDDDALEKLTQALAENKEKKEDTSSAKTEKKQEKNELIFKISSDDIPTNSEDIVKDILRIKEFDSVVCTTESENGLTIAEKQRMYALPKKLLSVLNGNGDKIISVIENSPASGKRYFTKLIEAYNTATKAAK